MGASKAGLAWGGTTLLAHTADVLGRAGVDPVVVVVAPGQTVRGLGAGVEVVEDPREGLGPLQGLAAGLAAVAPRAPWAFVTATDLPFLHETLVATVLRARVGDVDVVVPRAQGRLQPLVAAYRTALAGRADALVTGGRRDLAALLESSRLAVLDEQALLADVRVRAVDPALQAFADVDTPRAYEDALTRAPWDRQR